MLKTLHIIFFSLMVYQAIAQDAEVSITTPYYQNFDGIGTTATATMPSAWKIEKQFAGNSDYRKVLKYDDAGAATEYIAGNGNFTTGGVYNFGAGIAEEATDRAIGFLGSNTGLRNGNLYLRIKNTGATNIDELLIKYDIEKYRNSNLASGIRIQLFYSTDGETWTDGGTDFYNLFAGTDGNSNGYTNAPGVAVPVSAVLKDAELNPVSLAAGASLYLAWNYSVPSGTSGINGSAALGIDNVAIGDVATLPLKFTSFNAKSNGLTKKQALLTWTTEQEINTDYFEIERAGHNSIFEKVGTLTAANSSGQHSYSFTDTQPLSGISYYRIKQVDKDGKYTYSETKSVKNDVFALAVYPNPATHSISVVVPQSLEQGKLVIYSPAGEKIFTKNNITSADKIDISQFSAGFYFVEISKQNNKEIAKFLKQ